MVWVAPVLETMSLTLRSPSQSEFRIFRIYSYVFVICMYSLSVIALENEGITFVIPGVCMLSIKPDGLVEALERISVIA